MESSLHELLNKEQENRDKKCYTECLSICIKILKLISNYKEDNIFDTISTIFHHKNQSNYLRIGIITYIISNNYLKINNNKNYNLKVKFYQLLVDSFKKDTINDRIQEKNDIIQYFEESKTKSYDKLDNYILSLESIFLNEKFNRSNRNIFNNSEKQKSIIQFDGKNILENNDLDEDLIVDESQQNQITQLGLVDDLTNNAFDLNNLNDISKNKLSDNEIYLSKKYKPNNKLPMIMVSVSVNLNSSGFMDLIGKTFSKLNYRNICTIKSNLRDNINIYEYHPNNFFEGLLYCFSNKRAFIKNIFQVITILKKDENNFSSGINYYLNDYYERKIAIRTVRGSEKNIVNFIIKFLKLFSSSVNKIKIIKQSKIFSKFNLEQILNEAIEKRKELLLKSINYPKKNFIQFSEEKETIVEKSNKKANQYYDIYKTLSNTEYELGKSIFDFIEKFKIKYNEITSPDSEEKIEDFNTRPLMVEIVKMIELTTNTLNCNFNNNNNFNSKFFDTASEQFIFNKIYHYLYNIYNKKYEKENEEYLTIKKDIKDSIAINDILNNVGINNKYKGNTDFPYKNVIETINKIEYEKYIKNKFKILTQSSLEMRNYYLDYTSGKEELVSMDDELPIVIYITTQLNIGNLFAELNMIDDYIKCTMRDDLVQNKMVINLLSGLSYLCKNWDTKSKTFIN
jgi:hypothetical protein